jgi:Na+/H+ antiporter NhaD/arsenite permease-like protein/mannitol/fructose-specific phosphotransferase system IIA component (Ntr-type)
MKFEDTLSKSFVLLDPEVRTARELFRSFAVLLREKGVIEDEAGFVSELEASEARGSTGIGQGIALPHLMMDELDRSHILIARVREGIPFNSLDGQPAKLIILLLSAKKKRAEYLKNLARVARVLQRENVIDMLLETPDPVSVVSIVCCRHKPTYLRSHSRLLYYLGTVVAVFLLFALIMPRVSVPEGDAAAAEAGYLKYNEPEWVQKQVVAGGIFLATVIGTLLFWRHRVAIAAFGLGILLLTGTMDLEMAIQFMNIPTILFLISMMVVISYMESLGFFEYLVSWIVNRTGPYPRRIFLTLMLSAGVLGGLVNEVTAIFIAVAIGISISNQLNLNPFPFVIGLVFATNTASALTMIGNPIGIYIAFAGGLNFADFLRWATPISLVIVLLITGVLLVLFRKQIPARARAKPGVPMTAEPRVNPGRMKTSGILFVLLICLIGFSHEIDSLLGLLPNTSIVAIPITMAGIVIFMDREKGRMLIQAGVDWWTILFFMFLFAKAACLEYTGVTPKIAYQVLSISGEAQAGLPGVAYSVTIVSLVVITVFTALASGFADNLPIIAALVPVIRTMEVAGLPHSSILWWGLLFGGCLGGNLTLIGSSANMVALSIYEKSEGKVIGFVTWIKYGFPVVVISLLVALLLLVLQIGASS